MYDCTYVSNYLYCALRQSDSQSGLGAAGQNFTGWKSLTSLWLIRKANRRSSGRKLCDVVLTCRVLYLQYEHHSAHKLGSRSVGSRRYEPRTFRHPPCSDSHLSL